MTTYTCKCGKTFEGKGDSVTTGMRVPRADYTVDHFCFGCPFMKDVNVDFLECRGTRETPVYGTTASCVSSKASTLHVSSLDFDFIRDMSDFYNSLAVEPPKNTPTRGMEGGSGKYPFSFDFPKNNKGEKAKRELIDRFFAPVQGEDNYREMFYRKDISGWAEQINLYHKIRDAKEEANAFDGLEKAVTGSSTEFTPGTAIDLSNSAAIDTNYKVFLDELDNFLALLDGRPSALLMNMKLWAKFRAAARRSASFTETKDRFGQNITTYDDIPLIDLGAKPGSNSPIVGINATTGVSPLYAVRLGMDGFHGVSMAGKSPVESYMPDFTTPGAVKTGEVEMVAAVALKATKAAGIMRGLKVQ